MANAIGVVFSTTKKEQVMFNPLQVATEATNVFWQGVFQQLSQELNERVRQEEFQLQVDLCHLPVDDPRLVDALLKVGAGARAFFSQYKLPVLWIQYPFLRQQILSELEKFVAKFEALENQVASAARISPHRWEKGEYSHDLSQVVGEKPHYFHLVEHLGQSDPRVEQAVAAELAQEVRVVHKARMRANQQMG